jgi:hypothetical protein
VRHLKKPEPLPGRAGDVVKVTVLSDEADFFSFSRCPYGQFVDASAGVLRAADGANQSLTYRPFSFDALAR